MGYHDLHEKEQPDLSHGEIMDVPILRSNVSIHVKNNHKAFDWRGYRKSQSAVPICKCKIDGNFPDVNVLRLNSKGLSRLFVPQELLGLSGILATLVGFVRGCDVHENDIRCYLTVRNGGRFNRPLDFHSDGFQNGVVGLSHNEFSFIWSTDGSLQSTIGVDLSGLDFCEYDVNDLFCRSVRKKKTERLSGEFFYLISPYCIHSAPLKVSANRLFVRLSFVYKDATAGLFWDNPMLSFLDLPSRRVDIRDDLSRLVCVRKFNC